MLQPGCARRAYNDVYVENMAAEIRDLEDQLYEYDSEYRMLENELESLQAENARLQSTLSNTITGNQSRLGRPAQPSRSPGADNIIPAPLSGSSPSDNSVPSNSSNALPPTTPAQPKSFGAAPKPAPKLDNPTDLGPDVSMPPAANASPSTLPAPLPGSSPGAAPNLPTNPPTIAPPATLPSPKAAPGSNNNMFDNLQPPTIEPGEAMPPNMPIPKINPASPMTLDSNHDLEIELGRIPVPGQLASSSDGVIRSQPATPPMPSDTRISEVRFHPSLCRAVNLDEQGDDDGLYLVLQPMNEGGQFVPVAADLLVLAVDLSRDEKHANIGRWSFSADEVKSKLQPIGSSQGVHLSLPFTGPTPGCDRVLVFVYYTLSDGRRVVNEREILLNNTHRQSTVWVPRAKQNTPGATNNPVRTASATGPAKR